MSIHRIPPINCTSIVPCGQCLGCARENYCDVAWFPLVTDEQLNNPEFLRDARNFASSFTITKSLWVSEVFDLNVRRPMPICRKNKHGIRVKYDPPMEELFIFSDEVIEAGEVDKYMDAQRDWLHSFLCTPVPDHVTPYVTATRREHARCVLTLIGSVYPYAFAKWGVRPKHNELGTPDRDS